MLTISVVTTISQLGKSELTADPEKLILRAGEGEPVNAVARGEAGFRERIDFGEQIGFFVDNDAGVRLPTARGILHYKTDGRVHIVPSRPREP